MEKKESGAIRQVGFSYHGNSELFCRLIDAWNWDFCQIQLNYMDANIQAGMKGYYLAEQKQVPMVIMEPIKGGSLAAFAEDITGMFKELKPDASVASFALRWVGTLPNIKVVLSGMSTMEQVEDNLKTFGDFEPLSQKESDTIDEIVKLINSRVQNGCTGCRYCMPCPAGVDIPGCFSAWNTYYAYQNYNVVKWNWEEGIGEAHQAKNCIKCGKCEKMCPQHLEIRKYLEYVAEHFEV